MPSQPPPSAEGVLTQLQALGAHLRAHRKSLRISATTVAEAAGLSRVTLHRIEHGEPSVTMGAYLNVMAALGLALPMPEPVGPGGGKAEKLLAAHPPGWVPAQVVLKSYPQLAQLAWQVQGLDTLMPQEAWNIYQRNARHLDPAKLSPSERELMHALQQAYGEGEQGV
jgi:transcriptional regulator with XRE-family HTH domain